MERPERFDTTDAEQREDGLAAAALAVRRGELVLLPTDTVYGIGADAFDPAAVQRLLTAKGRGREMPPPVLISTLTTLDALATDVPEWARRLTDEFWPGPLTLVLRQQGSLQWDLGDARETVALRMPEDDVALELIQRTGPLAVSSANTTGMPAALDAQEALSMLADEVTAVLDAGRTTGGTASTILDCTGDEPRVLREGALPLADLRRVLTDAGHPLGDLEEQKPWPPEIVYENPDAQDEADGGSDAGSPPDPEPERAVGTRSATRRPSARQTAAKKAPAKKAPAKKATVTKSTAKKATATKSTAAKATAKKATAKKATATKLTAKRTTAEKTPAKSATATKKTATKKAATKKTATKKTATKRAPAKKPAKGSDSGA